MTNPNALMMNIPTGSVDTFENWEADLGKDHPDLASLVEVVWDEKE